MKIAREGHALIIGGSIAGLATARVLSEHFLQVTVIERDLLTDDLTHRKGTPHARHAHGLTSKGARAVESLFPGLRRELEMSGAPIFDHGESILTRVPPGQVPFLKVGQSMQVFTRPLMESLIRKRVMAIPGVQIRDGLQVTALQTDISGEYIIGARARRNSILHVNTDKMGQSFSIPADLVVDASGRFSELPRWLEKIGFTIPTDRVVDAGVVYSTCTFKGPERDWQVIYHFNDAPNETRGAYVLRTEKNDWLVTIYGAMHDIPPVQEKEFREFVSSLNNPALIELLSASIRLSPITRYARTENRKRLYHSARRWPKRLVALGDAVCAFNPTYGQGMTMATIEAIELGEIVERQRATSGLDKVSETFQIKLAKLIRWPWLLAISGDLLWEAKMRQTKAWWGARAFHWYKARLYISVLKDPCLLRLLLGVFHMERHPLNLFHPVVIVRVLRSLIRS